MTYTCPQPTTRTRARWAAAVRKRLRQPPTSSWWPSSTSSILRAVSESRRREQSARSWRRVSTSTRACWSSATWSQPWVTRARRATSCRTVILSWLGSSKTRWAATLAPLWSRVSHPQKAISMRPWTLWTTRVERERSKTNPKWTETLILLLSQNWGRTPMSCRKSCWGSASS